MASIARVLVRLPNWLGDALLARPLLHALRAAQPGAECVGVAPAPLARLLSADGALDRIEDWPAETSARSALASRIAAAPPDVALVLPPSFSSAYFAWRTRARRRIGYRGEWREALLTDAPARPPRGDRHLSDEYVDLGAAVAARATTPPPLTLDAEAHARARDVLAREGLDGARLVVLGPGAIYGPAKRWPTERFAELARRWAHRGYRIAVCGTASERDACEAVVRDVGPAAVSLAGATDLLSQAGVCAAAALAVCNDSGLAHLSAAVSAPTVVIFGSTSSAWTAPLGARVRVVQRAPVCSPCFQRTCRIGYRCLTAVTVDAVDAACGALGAAA